MIKALFLGTTFEGSEHWLIETDYGSRNYFRRELDEMPFDRTDDSGFGLVHATGYEYYDEVLGNWYAEYENDADYQTIEGRA